GGGDRQLAVLDAGAGHRVLPPLRGAGVQAELVEGRDERLDAILLDVEDDDLLHRRQRDAVRAVRLDDVGQALQDRAGDAADRGGDADVEAAVDLAVDADVVGRRVRHRRGVQVDQAPPEVLVLEHLAELLDAPVLDEELQSGAGPQPPVAVVAEDADDALPHLRHVLQWDPGAETPGQVGVGRQSAADPHVEPRAVLGVHGADEGDVVDLRDHVVAGVPADRRLELARKVRERLVADVPALDRLDGGGAVDDLVGRDAGDGAAQDDAGAVAAGLLRGQADRLEALP